MAEDSVTPLHVVSTEHEDMIHDSQFDYYGKRLATASSDRTVRVFDVSGETPQVQAVIRGHEGPVWEVAWGHPSFGNVLASCSYDNTLRIHRETGEVSPETNAPSWESKKILEHSSSVNSIAWAPYECGAKLAAASSDGKVTVCIQEGGQWKTESIDVCDLGCTSVSWAPYSHLGYKEGSSIVERIAVGCCDNTVKLFSNKNGRWEVEKTLEGASDWIRDVAWSPSSGMPANVIAGASEDGKVYIWKWTKPTDKVDAPSSTIDFKSSPVWRVSWSVTGAMLAISSGSSEVSLWKEELDGKWKRVAGDEAAAMGGGGGGARQLRCLQ